ncbi:kinase-like protein, partial [Schizopora paradoxa]
RELYILSKLWHPNILPFTGYLVRNGFPAIVSPWIENGNLRSQIQTGRLSSSDETALSIVRTFTLYLHSQNVVHCDLKSPNVLLSSTNRPIIADFGLSRFVGNDTSVPFSLTSTGPATVRWSAPELFDGVHHSNATDVWAFGMLLYVR